MTRRPPVPWLIVAFLAGCLAAAWLSPRSAPPTPWTPLPNPHESRPILAQIVRLAKAVGWFALMAQEPPAPAPEPDQRVVEVEEPREIGADGVAVLRNAKGW